MLNQEKMWLFVAEQLEVEIGEVFKLNETSGKYCLTLSGLQVQTNDECKPWVQAKEQEAELIHGKMSVKKIPWKPKENEEYCFLKWSYDTALDIEPCFGRWIGCYEDYASFSLGNVFRTEEEALAHAIEVVKRYKKRYEES